MLIIPYPGRLRKPSGTADPIGAGAFSSRRIDPELLHAYSFPKSGNLCESGTLSKNYNGSCTRARSAA